MARFTNVALSLVLTSTLVQQAGAATRTWSNTADGASGVWTDGGNWIPSGVPQSGEAIVITGSGNYSSSTGGSFNIGSLSMGGSAGTKHIDVTGGTTLAVGGGTNVDLNAVFGVYGTFTGGDATIQSKGLMALQDGSKATGSNMIRINTGGSLLLRAAEVRGRTIASTGRVLQEGTVTYTQGARVQNDGVYDVSFGDVRVNSATPIKVTNTGTIRMMADTPVRWDADIDNSGTVLVGTSTLNVSNANYNQSAGKTTVGGGNLAGQININGGAITGTGTITGTLNNAGTISLAAPTTIGALNVAGSFVQLPTGILEIKIAGINNFDQLLISGTATIGGQLTLKFLNNFVPAPGSIFRVVTFGTRAGQFAILNGIQVGNVTLKPVYDATGVSMVAQLSNLDCTAASLCIQNDRFDVSLTARDQRTGNTGPGVPVLQNDQFGYFSIPAITGNPSNPEVFVKVVDGRAVNGKFWVFYGGLTDLEYTLTVKDRTTSTVKSYKKDAGSACGQYDTGAFSKLGEPGFEELTTELHTMRLLGGTHLVEIDAPEVTAAPETACAPTANALCLLGSRFSVKLSARDQRTGNTGQGQSISQNDLFGYFSIPALTGDPGNVEVFTKVLDGRPINGKFWVFYGGLTDLEYTLTLVDTGTNTTKTYTKAAGSPCGAFDTSAF